MSATHPTKPRCHAHNRQGKQCGNLSVPMAGVCRMHGGLIPNVQLAAADRLRRMLPTAVDVMQELLADGQPPAVRFAVARDILDRNGFKATEKVQTDGKLIIEVEYVDHPLPAPAPLTPHQNGTSAPSSR